MVRPEPSAIDVGQRWLGSRLARWHDVLPALRAGADPEALHRWRVAGRRVAAALRWFEAAAVPGARGLRRRVQALLRRTGPLRDLDVRDAQWHRWQQSGVEGLALWRSRLAKQRARRQAALVVLLVAPRTQRLGEALQRLVLRPPGTMPPQIEPVAARVLRQRYRVVRRRGRQRLLDHNAQTCHRLRLGIKTMRYCAEPLATRYGRPLRVLLRRLRALQGLLGRLNDAQHLLDDVRVLQHRRPGLAPSELALLARLVAQAQQQLDEGHVAVDKAWRRVRRAWRPLRRLLPKP